MKEACFLAFAILNFPACSSICNTASCEDNTTLELSLISASREGLPAGTYDVAIEADKGLQTLSCAVQIDIMGGCSGSSSDVFGNFGPCDGSRVEGTSGCPSGANYIGIRIANQPRTLSIVVRRDGNELGQYTLTPRYGTSYPNGPDCDGECRSASVDPSTIAL